MEAAKIGPDSQVNYQEDPRRRIILAPYVSVFGLHVKANLTNLTIVLLWNMFFF